MKSLLPLTLLVLLSVMNGCQPKPVVVDNKIWLHRANSIEEAQRYQYEYGGLEIDVYYVDSLETFLIKHDLDAVSNLTMDEWCDALDNVSRLGLWFDFKNLDERNGEAALQALISIRDKYHLNGKLYVESPQYQQLKAFRDAGFSTSFYIPYYYPALDDSVMYSQQLNKIQDAIDSGVDAISGNESQYEYLKTAFPTQTKLIWTINKDAEYQSDVIKNVGSDSLVDVLLLPVAQTNR